MKLTKVNQNALLLALYASRAGRCTLREVSEELGLPLSFLEQIAAKLRRAGVLQSFRGPGGGYEIDGNPTVLDVFLATGYKPMSYGKATMSKAPEIRALGHLMGNLQAVEYSVLDRKIRNLNMELAAAEMRALDNMASDTSVN